MLKTPEEIWNEKASEEGRSAFLQCFTAMPRNKKNELTVETLGAFLRECRKANGYTQEDLANFAGVHVNLVGRIERGASDARASTVLHIVSVLCSNCPNHNR